MATPRPFGAPTTFTPRFTPQGLLQRSQAEVNSQVARMRNLAGRGFGPFPSDGPIGPGPRPIAPARLPVPGGSGILNTFGRGATALGGLLYGADKLKSLLRQAKILPQPSSGVGSIPPTDRRGESYRDAELRLSAAARAAGGPSAGGGIGGGNAASFIPYVGSGASSSPAAERAYQQAASSAAQQAASNPLFQKYRVADLTKQYNEAKTPEERTNIGMQIWAQTNPQLAAKLKQGQAGYAEAHSAPGMSNAGGYTLPSLPLSSSSFTAATQMQSPVTLEQNFGAPFPGVGMVSANPAAFKPQPGQVPYATKLDMQQTFGGPGTFDPAALNITQDQRRALINQYAQGLVNKPFPPAAK